MHLDKNISHVSAVDFDWDGGIGTLKSNTPAAYCTANIYYDTPPSDIVFKIASHITGRCLDFEYDDKMTNDNYVIVGCRKPIFVYTNHTTLYRVIVDFGELHRILLVK